MKQKGCELCSYDFREKKQWFCQSVVANNSNIDITAKVEKTRKISALIIDMYSSWTGDYQRVMFPQLDSYTVRDSGNFAYGINTKRQGSIIRQRMMLFDAVPQTSAIEVGVDLGGQYRFMPQHFLYLTNTGSTL